MDAFTGRMLSERSLLAKNQLDPAIHFNRTPTCDRHRHGHRSIASTRASIATRGKSTVTILTILRAHCITSQSYPNIISFYPRDAMLARVLAMALCLSGCLSVSVCPPQVGVLSKRVDRSSWFWHRGFFRPILHCVARKFRYRDK